MRSSHLQCVIMKEVLTIFVRIEQTISVEGQAGSAAIVLFSGYAESEYLPASAPLPNKSVKNLFLGSAIQGSKVLLFYALYCIKRKNYLVRYMLITAVQTSRKRCRESGFIFMHNA